MHLGMVMLVQLVQGGLALGLHQLIHQVILDSQDFQASHLMVRNPIQWGLTHVCHGFHQWDFQGAHLPGFPPCYSQVFSVRGEHVNISDGRGYGTGNGHISPDGLIIPGEPQNMIPDEEVVSEESEQDPIPSEGDVGQGEPEWDPVAPGEDLVPKEPGQDSVSPEEDIEVPDDEGQGQAGIVPDEGELIGPEEPERDPAPEGDEGETPGNGESNGLGQGGILPDNGNPDNVHSINPDNPRVEIEALHQQLSQTQATLAKSVQVLQKCTAQDIQIKNLRELVEKQQGQFDSKILELQTTEKE